MNKIRVLLVEDILIAQKIAYLILGQLECDVVLASNGQEALMRISSEQFDIIFMDLGLPDVDGLTVVESIRKIPGENANTPIVALTASANYELKEASFESGINEFLCKPLLKENAQFVIQKYHKRDLGISG